MAQSVWADFTISKVEINCVDKLPCEKVMKTFSSLRRQYNSTEHFYKVLKLYIANEGVKELSFDVIEDNKLNILLIKIKQKPRIIEIFDPKFKGKYSVELPSILPIKREDYLDQKKIKDTERIFYDICREKGFPNVTVQRFVKEKKTGVAIGFELNLGDPIIIDDMIINSRSEYLNKFVSKRIFSLKNEPFDIQFLRTELEELKNLLVNFGYYLIDFELKYKYLNKTKVKLFLDIKNPNRYTFYFKNNNFQTTKVLKKLLSENYISSKRELSIDNISQVLQDHYNTLGFRFTKFKIKLEKKKAKNKDLILYHYIDVKEGSRSVVENIIFKGNNFFTQEDLFSFYNESAPEQALEEIYDPQFYKNFVNLLREKYITNGFVSVFVDKPFTQFNFKNKKSSTVFRIREGIRTSVGSISIKGAPTSDYAKLVELIQTKQNRPFNPVLFKEDIDRIKSYLKEQGYYFSRISNLNSVDMVQYLNDNSEVKINIEIETGRKLYADDIIIIGNTATRKRLIRREIAFKSGDLITSDILEKSQAQLLSLGIFSSVQIKPVSQETQKTDILIFVREKDFGLIEIAPGVRSDLGFKFSSTITYNNIDGLNKRISFQGSVNRRFDLNSLDDERRNSSKVLLEYDTSVNFSENHILYTDIDFTMSLSKARKRFFSYDADIDRLGYTLSYDFTDWFEVSFKQQIERISQFEATDDTNHGHFKIGSITPAVRFDFRNRPINPTKGALFDLSYEVANPAVGSQEESDLTIEYYKFISRNRFYVPVGERVVLAMSAAFGIQETTADRGLNSDGEAVVRIPSIKAFRLSGADIVRGFEDSEINTLVSGEDISDVELNNRAYMANFKFEPRYYLSDTTIFGVFYDAGRVFVNEFDQDQLRSAAGVTFKYITPVGTLDFDYGIKLLRKEDSSGKLESPGRLHVSIGFF